MSRGIWIAAFGLFTVVCLAFWGAAVWLDRLRSTHEAEADARKLVHFLAEHAEQALNAGNDLVRSIATQARDWDMKDPDAGQRLHGRMAEAVKGAPQINSLWILDSDGNAVVDSWNWPGRGGNFHHRRYFAEHRDGRLGLFIGPAGIGYVTSAERFTLSRPIIGSDGQFRGVAVAGAYVDYFRSVYERANSPDNTQLYLFTSDGEVLTAWPPADVPSRLGEMARNAAAADGVQVAPPDRTHVTVYRRLPYLPVVAMVSLPLSPTLEKWRHRTLLSAVAPVAAVLGFAILMAYGLQAARRVEEVNQQLEERVKERTSALATSEAVARARYEELEALYRDAPVGLALFDPDLKFQRVNETLVEMNGIARSDHLGRTVDQVVPELAADVVPHLRSVLESGRPVLNREMRGQTPKQPGVERVWRASFYPVFPAEGPAVAVGAVIHEVTAEVRAQEAVRNSERELKLVADALPALITFVDADQRFRFVNRAYAQWAGREASQIERRHLRDILPEKAYERVAENVQAVLRGERLRRETMLPDWQGRERHFDSQYIPRIEKGGRVLGYYLFASDISDRKEGEQRQSLLMAELDHRVRNILASIQSMVALTEAGTDSKESFGAALRGRIDAMARTHGLLTQHRWRGAGVEEIVRDELRAYAPEKQAFTIDVPADCVLAPRQALNMALVVHELATNAAKYGALSCEGGHVSVRCTLEALPQGAVLDFLWQERGGPPIKQVRRPGFGSRLITGALGNDPDTEVALTFPPEGARCHIRLRLPVDSVEPGGEGPSGNEPGAETGDATGGETGAGVERRPQPATPVKGSLAGLRVFVAEDEMLLAMELERQLLALGATVVGPAASRDDAERLVEAGEFDVAILDVNLRGLSSEPVADQLLQRKTPFFFLTGYEAGEVLPERLHAVPALQKPADEASLYRWLRRLVDGDAA